ncbi:MAG: UDP-glucose 4-epimerase GalE [bacterium]
MKILVTGGAGYIGSHLVKMLKELKKDILVADNLSRGHIEAIPNAVDFVNVDLKNYNDVEKIFENHTINSIIHFAAFAYVGESVENPQLYYENNVLGSINLLKAANKFGIKKIVFSSTCSLYGNPIKTPISELEPTKPINPYAYTKQFIEKILADFDTAYNMKYVALRYFNAAGADFSGEIGESHFPEPHLIPLVLFTALKKRNKISVFGDDYNTPDGTCVRDYIHINDLADAHIKALNYLEAGNNSSIINLGTGIGYSVKEIINMAKEITGFEIPFEIVERRAGDPDILVADNKKALEVLGWKNKYNLEDIIKSAYKWHCNPKY